MPSVSFAQLPDDARVWVFAADRAITGSSAERLLGVVDKFLGGWAAHGAPLTCARDWRDDQFLAIGVDRRTEGASGCSIDGLFRTLQGLEREIGSSMVGGGRVHFRDSSGSVRTVARGDVPLSGPHALTPRTPVFDTTISTAGDWRSRFETVAEESWVGELLRN